MEESVLIAWSMMTKRLITILNTFVLSTQVSAPLIFDNWLYLIGTWSEPEGLSLYENGVLKNSDALGKVEAPRPVNAAQTNLCIGGRVPNVFGSDFAKFSMKSLAIFDETIPSAHTSSVSSFYRDYDGVGK